MKNAVLTEGVIVVRKRGQGMFEYILLLAGILLIVVLAIVLLRGGIFQSASTETAYQGCLASLSRSSECYNPDGTWLASGTVTVSTDCETALDAGAGSHDDGTPGNLIVLCGDKP
jgi:uncharacterized protein (UPF0333 family)